MVEGQRIRPNEEKITEAGRNNRGETFEYTGLIILNRFLSKAIAVIVSELVNGQVLQ